ncbi:MAG: hypothetical protein EBX41_09695, partial [Chitinophagia bacterium]|nr:hypothetical protein [Chitinophagia bacterium]
ESEACKGFLSLLPNINNYINKPMQLPFRKAKLVRSKGENKWFIKFYCTDPDTNKYRMVRKTYDINRYDIPHREVYAQAIIRLINEALDNGYNYWVEVAKIKAAKGEKDKETELLPNLPKPHWSEVVNNKYPDVVTALTATLEAKRAELTTQKSFRSYESALRFFIAFLKRRKWDKLSPNDISPDMCDEFVLERVKSGVVNRTVNGMVSKISPLFLRMAEKRIIKENPFDYIKSLPKKDSNLFANLTEEELQRVKVHLQEKHPNLLLFSQFIYYAWTRNNTVSMLQRKNLNFTDKTITINGDTTKSGRSVVKQMLQPLHDILIAAGIDKLPEEYYLFSNRALEPGVKKIGSVDTRATEAWKRLVIEELQIEKHLYALKHTGAAMYLNKNEAPDLSWLQKQMEHHDLQTTSIYVAKRQVKRIDESKANLPDY